MPIEPNLVLNQNKNYAASHRNYVRNSYQQKPKSFLEYENPSFIEENKDILWVLAIGAAVTGAYFAFRKKLKFPVEAVKREIKIAPEKVIPFPEHPWISEVVRDEIKSNPSLYKVIVLKPGTLDKMTEQIKYAEGHTNPANGQYIEGISSLLSDADVNIRHRKIYQFGVVKGREFMIVDANDGKSFKLSKLPQKDLLISMFNGLADIEEKGFFAKNLNPLDLSFDQIGAIIRNTFKIYRNEQSPVHYAPRTSSSSVVKNFFWDILDHMEHIKEKLAKRNKTTFVDNISKEEESYRQNFTEALIHHLNNKANFMDGKNADAAKFFRLKAKLLEENNPEFLQIQKISDTATAYLEKAAELWYQKGEENVTLDNGLKAAKTYLEALKKYVELRESTVKFYGTESTPLSDYANMQLHVADEWLKELTNWLYVPQDNKNYGTLARLNEIIANMAPSNEWDIESVNYKLLYNYLRPDEGKGATATAAKLLNDKANEIRSAVYGDLGDIHYPSKIRNAIAGYLDYVDDMIRTLKAQ